MPELLSTDTQNPDITRAREAHDVQELPVTDTRNTNFTRAREALKASLRFTLRADPGSDHQELRFSHPYGASAARIALL